MRDPYARYLHLLGFDHSPCGLEGLRQLVRAHILVVPFENVSKLLLFDKERRGREISLTEFLDGIERDDLGGTCYTSNPFFAELLRELGYDALLLGADMNHCNVHTSIRVHLDGISYHIDCGYASPFLEPISLDRLPHEIRRGNLCWLFDQASDHRLAMRLYCDGQQVHGYAVNEIPRERHFFRATVEDSFRAHSTFMKLLRLVRIFPEHTVELRNRTLRVHRGLEISERTLDSIDDLRQAVNDEFLMPRCPIEKAVEILESLTGVSYAQLEDRSLYA